MNKGKNRQIEITLAGDAVRDGRVSVSLFAKTLQSIQEIVFQIAASYLKRDMKGPMPAVIKEKCELFLVRTMPGSLQAVLELPEKPMMLFPDDTDFSEDVIESTQTVIDAVADLDAVKLEQTIPQPYLRRRVIQRIRAIAPADGSDYRLSFRFNGGAARTLVRPSKESMIKLAAIPASFEAIEEPVVIKFVDVKGMAQLEDGDIKKWVETYEISEINQDLDHVWRPHQIKSKGRMFDLVHPIACVIEKQDDLLYTENKHLSIIVYGNTREEVIQEFSDEFAMLWDVIASEADEKLTHDALELKSKLIALVRKVESHGE
jgi:hypothetical protein